MSIMPININSSSQRIQNKTQVVLKIKRKAPRAKKAMMSFY